MIEKLTLLHPEIALFVAACVVVLIGVSPRVGLRRLGPWIAALGLAVALGLGLASPGAEAASRQGALLPGLLPYAKSVIAGVALLILPVLSGTVDTGFERAVQKGRRFDPADATRGEFYAFFLFSVMGVMLTATADDLIWLFLSLELTSLPTYIMVAMSTPRLRSQESGVKYFFLGAFGAAIFLYGFALLYGAAGTTFLPEIARAFATGEAGLIGTAGLVISMIGVAFKIAAVPMHFYAADVYQGAAAPVAAYLAFAPKAAGMLALILLLSMVGWTEGASGTSLPPEIRVTLWVMAAMTMTVGNALAILQRDVKRILAYSSIAHSGYMLVGLVVGPGTGSVASNGLGAALFYLLTYGVMNLGAFAVLAALTKRVEGTDERVEIETVDDLRGLARSHPWLAWSMALCAASLLGLPPLLGFFGKLYLFTSAIEAGEILLVIVLGVNSAAAAFYYLRLVAAPLLEPRDDFAEAPEPEPAVGRRLAAMLSAAGVILLVPFAGLLIEKAGEATEPGGIPLVESGVEENPLAAGREDPVATRSP